MSTRLQGERGESCRNLQKSDEGGALVCQKNAECCLTLSKSESVWDSSDKLSLVCTNELDRNTFLTHLFSWQMNIIWHCCNDQILSCFELLLCAAQDTNRATPFQIKDFISEWRHSSFGCFWRSLRTQTICTESTWLLIIPRSYRLFKRVFQGKQNPYLLPPADVWSCLLIGLFQHLTVLIQWLFTNSLFWNI